MSRPFRTAALALLGALAACAPVEEEEAAAPAEASLLASSTPADGATVASPDRLDLVFREPVRLAEVTVTGADGMAMPMMVTSAGEQTRYSLPLHGIAPGAYTVRWRAVVAGGGSRDGAFRFTVAR